MLLQKDYKKYLAEIIIDGYTDTDGDYDYNLELSQKRSLAVAQYLTEIRENFLSSDEISELQNYLTVNGHGSANPVLDSDGNVDKDASRRVEVKFRLKDDEMINELNQIMNTDKTSDSEKIRQQLNCRIFQFRSVFEKCFDADAFSLQFTKE